MKTQLPLRKGDTFKTSGNPYPVGVYKVLGIQTFGKIRMLWVYSFKNGQRLNLQERYVFGSYADASSKRVILDAKAGNKAATKEFIKRFKKLPKSALK